MLVAGGGIGGLEAILALRELSSELPITLLTPADRFTLTPLSVAEPFGAGPAPTLSLREFCADQHVELERGELSEVWPGPRRALTDVGDELPYDALLVCSGARRRHEVRGSLSFWGPAQVEAVEQLAGEAAAGDRISCVVPGGVTWPLPLYELALLIADQVRDRGCEITITTPEPTPLAALGGHASDKVGEILAAEGIGVNSGVEDPSAEPAAEWVISVPALDVPEIPGLTQGAGGFVVTDSSMRVEGAKRVWAVGDVTWFPVKQGGIAAQQADVAAADIARTAGVDTEPRPFAPVLRAALLTADGPYYLRAGAPDGHGEQRAPLWWPPAKVAGRLLAPYLASRLDPDLVARPLKDLEPNGSREADHEEALGLALTGADLDADAGAFRRALHWLEIAEGLNLVVPEAYRAKRRRWEERVAAGD